jgi:hypothetical protein
MLRSEAEREFAKTRLASLEIVWSATVGFVHADCQYYYHSKNFLPGGFRGVEQDGNQARFTFFPGDDISRVSEKREPMKLPEHPWLETALSQALRNADVHFPDGPDSQSPTIAVSSLGWFKNTTPLPAVKLDMTKHEHSFDSKSFLNAFYGDYAYAGKLIQPSAPYQVVASWIEAADRDFKRHSVAQGDEKDAWKKSWVKEYGKSEDWAFEGALVARLVRAGCKAVSERGMNEKAMSDVRGLVSLLRNQRNEFAVSCIIEGETET